MAHRARKVKRAALGYMLGIASQEALSKAMYSELSADEAGEIPKKLIDGYIGGEMTVDEFISYVEAL